MIKSGFDEYVIGLRVEALIEALKENKENFKTKTRKDIIETLSKIKNMEFSQNSIQIISDYEGQSEEVDIKDFFNDTIDIFITNNQLVDLKTTIDENEKLFNDDKEKIKENLELFLDQKFLEPEGIFDIEIILKEINDFVSKEFKSLEQNEIVSPKEEDNDFDIDL